MGVWVLGFPRDESIQGAGGGSYTGGPGKFLWHTTEGGWDSSMSVFRNSLTAPHVMADPKTRRKVQFIPLDRSAYALRNESGDVETNRDQVLQVEIVGFAGESHTWPASWLEWLGVEVLAPMVAGAPFPIDITQFPTFYGEDAGFTLASTSARQRFSGSKWDGWNGQVGHQHAPENSHWDPGKLNVAKITEAAQGEAGLSAQDVRDINRGTALIVGAAAAKIIDQNQRQTNVLRTAIWKAAGWTADDIAAAIAEDPNDDTVDPAALADALADELGARLAGP